jgi:hypothetical protein
MRTHFRWPAPITGWALAAAAGLAAFLHFPQQPLPAHRHGPIHVRRHYDGSLKRGLRNEWISSNWAGYELANFQTGQRYIRAHMSWVVPSVSYGPSTDSTSSPQYTANWVGIGGFCENSVCSEADNTLIQLGTEQDVAPSGATQYYAWYEILPAAETPITTLTIHPGDVMTASLTCGSTCSQRKQVWTLSMTDETTRQSWSRTVSYASSKLSVEWIEEAPYLNGILPLANFGTAAFPGPDGNYAVSAPGKEIQMQDPWGQWANPSVVTVPNFNVCWGFETFTPC